MSVSAALVIDSAISGAVVRGASGAVEAATTGAAGTAGVWASTGTVAAMTGAVEPSAATTGAVEPSAGTGAGAAAAAGRGAPGGGCGWYCWFGSYGCCGYGC